MLPGTHALLHVRTPGQGEHEPALLCDVGFGGGPLEPLEFPGSADIDQDGWGFRLRSGSSAAALPASAQVWEMQQRGLHSRGYKRDTLAWQERRVRFFHDNIERWLAR